MNYPSQIDDYINASFACIKWLKTKNQNYAGIHLDIVELRAFVKLLGFEMIHPNHVEIIPTHDPEFMRLINLINGPHGHTILRILEIKREQQHDRLQP